jgi:hypothetical protein
MPWRGLTDIRDNLLTYVKSDDTICQHFVHHVNLCLCNQLDASKKIKEMLCSNDAAKTIFWQYFF